MNNWITFHDKGNTPLSPEEQNGLIPPLTTHQELNRWEHENIIEARKWIFSKKVLGRLNIFTENFIKNLHKKMFNKTWKWAGSYRLTNKNIGVPFYAVPVEMRKFEDDMNFWKENNTFTIDEMAIRIHHRLVLIHPFPNGNGRHARLFADVILAKNYCPLFTWGQGNLQDSNALRNNYISALKEADKGCFDSLMKFARSVNN